MSGVEGGDFNDAVSKLKIPSSKAGLPTWEARSSVSVFELDSCPWVLFWNALFSLIESFIIRPVGK